MHAYIHEDALDYCSGVQLLTSIRAMVTDLRQCHPELEKCVLADLSLRRLPTALSVTLYFKAKH